MAGLRKFEHRVHHAAAAADRRGPRPGISLSGGAASPPDQLRVLAAHDAQRGAVALAQGRPARSVRALVPGHAGPPYGVGALGTPARSQPPARGDHADRTHDVSDRLLIGRARTHLQPDDDRARDHAWSRRSSDGARDVWRPARPRGCGSLMARICVIREWYYPVDSRVHREIRALLLAGHEVDLICATKPGQPRVERDGAL